MLSLPIFSSSAIWRRFRSFDSRSPLMTMKSSFRMLFGRLRPARHFPDHFWSRWSAWYRDPCGLWYTAEIRYRMAVDVSCPISIWSGPSSPRRRPTECCPYPEQTLFIFPIDRFDNIGHIKGQFGNSRNRQSILVHMPIEWITPFLEAIAGGKVINIVNIKFSWFRA